MNETNYLKNKFNEDVLQAVEDSKKIGYVPARFIQMLQLNGNNAHEVVQDLVNRKVTDGLTTLCLKGRLDLSMEAIIIKPEYQELFSTETLNVCKKKLKSCGYKF